MLSERTIAPEDLDILTVTDDPALAVDTILAAARSEFGLLWEAAPRPAKFLGEGGGLS